MNWIKEKPTKIGYYCLRRLKLNDTEVNIAFVYEDIVEILGIQKEFRINADVLDDAEWYGPLEPPK